MTKAVVVVDTREQEPYSFDPQRINTQRRALPAGDYSLAGHESDIAVERKTLEDLVHTLIDGRARFRKELMALCSYRHACLVVEGNLDDVVRGNYRSGAHPNSVVGSILSVIVDYNVPVFFCSDRQIARLFTEDYLLRLHRKVT